MFTDYERIDHPRWKYRTTVVVIVSLPFSFKVYEDYDAGQVKFVTFKDLPNIPPILIFCKYAWDGASSLAIDTDTWMKASLVHDALCQLISLGVIPEEERGTCNKAMYDICLDEGMHPFRAWYSYQFVDKLYWAYRSYKRIVPNKEH